MYRQLVTGNRVGIKECLPSKIERERERVYLTPVGPGCGHMAAAAAEKRL